MNTPHNLPQSVTAPSLPNLVGNPDLSGPTIAQDSGLVRIPEQLSGPIRTDPDPTGPIRTFPASKAFPDRRKYFIVSQIAWLDDISPLRIIEKSRQVGISSVDAYDS